MMKQTFGLACLGLLLAGCLPTGPDSAERDELRLQRERWDALQPTTYEFVLQRICECVPPLSTPLKITVHEGEVRSVVNAQTEDPIPADSEQVRSIDELFALLDQALEQGTGVVTAEYDRDLGYPGSISIDPVEEMADDEIIYIARDLRSVE